MGLLHICTQAKCKGASKFTCTIYKMWVKLKVKDLKRGTGGIQEKKNEESLGHYILFSYFNYNHAIKESLKNTE